MSEHAPSNGLTGGDASGPSAQRDTSAESGGGRLNPAALPISYAAKMLTRAAGRQITEVMLRSDIDAGAPVNADGTLNLMHYTAWLVKEVSRRGD